MSKLLVACRIAGRSAALPADRVASIIELGEITAVPGSPPHILGLAALRSEALTVFDCRIALGLESTGLASEARAAVIHGHGQSYALVLDEVSDVVEVESEATEVPGGFGQNWEEVAAGLVETEAGPHLLIDIEKLLDRPLKEAA